jgi:hypothetical protein
MTLRRMGALGSALVAVFAAAAACVPGEQDTGEDEAGESIGTSDTAGELVCADFTNQSECDAQDNGEIACEWTMIARAVRTGDVCEVAQVGYCQVEQVNATISGCEVLTGCWEDAFVYPYYKVTPEGVLLIDTCGGTSEPGFAPCPSAIAIEDNPPECACACELAP